MEKILIVGGGTAGHLYPSISLLHTLKKKHPHLKIQAICAKNQSDKDILSEYLPSDSIFEIPVAKLRRYFSLQNFFDFFIFLRNIIWSLFFLYRNRPSVIFSKGGFVSLPVGLAAYLLRVPLILHETDSVMGLANTILSKLAHHTLCGFPSSFGTYIGNPVRTEFFTSHTTSKNQSIKILIFGGSQGSQALNNWARTFFLHHRFDNVDVLLITGKGKNSSQHIPHLEEKEFLSQGFIEAVHAADIVITRSGGSISELAAAKKCVILIPLPSAASNHQLKNAQVFSKNNAAILIEEKDLSTPQSTEKIITLINNPEQRISLQKNIASFATPETCDKIAQIIAPFFISKCKK